MCDQGELRSWVAAAGPGEMLPSRKGQVDSSIRRMYIRLVRRASSFTLATKERLKSNYSINKGKK